MSEKYHDSGNMAIDKTMKELHLPDSKELSQLTKIPTMEDSIAEAQRTTLIQSINEDMALAEKYLKILDKITTVNYGNHNDNNNEMPLSEDEIQHANQVLRGGFAIKFRQAAELWAAIDRSQLQKAEDLERTYEILLSQPEYKIQGRG